MQAKLFTLTAEPTEILMFRDIETGGSNPLTPTNEINDFGAHALLLALVG
jgi:hypothetical protein